MIPPSALDAWPRLAERLEGRRPVVFLDFDGTLSPVVEHHDDAAILATAKDAVEELARRVPVVVVSGRDREDVARRVGLPGLWYAGSHGFDIAGPETEGGDGGPRHRHEPQPDLAPLVAAAADELRRALADVPGAVVEAKRFAVSVHYRKVADEDLERVEEAVERVVAAEPRLARSRAKKVFEVRPALDWDKGDALLHLLRQPELVAGDPDGGDAAGDLLPLYIGDDLTDEDAFRAIDERPGGGVTVHVGDGSTTDFETRARWSLASPEEVTELLRRLARLA